MATSGKSLQPIIIKRVKKGGHGAHGGAWKIAYADFVTAMMAFFLLMWLLGSTTEADRKGIADYFNQPLKVILFGGPGSGGATSLLSGGGDDLTKSVGELASGNVEEKVRELGAQLARAELVRQERMRIATLREKIENIINVNPQLSEYKNQIRLEMVQDGLNIQIVDDQDRPMFDTGSALVKPYMRDILRAIAQALAEVENRISLTGHTDATPYGSGERAYSNWELSADRANASRRELVAAGLPEGKLARVVGMADKQLLFPDNPFDPRNRRISILVLTREAEERMSQSIEEAPAVGDENSARSAVEEAAVSKPMRPAGVQPPPPSKTP